MNQRIREFSERLKRYSMFSSILRVLFNKSYKGHFVLEVA
jgi:hypothetical protein